MAVLSLQCLTLGCSDKPPVAEYSRFDHLGFEIEIPNSDNIGDPNLVVHRLVVVGYPDADSSSPVVALDTMQIFSPVFDCDSSAVAFVCGEVHERHLVTLELTPPFTQDTVLSSTTSDNIDWLEYPFSFAYSRSSRILAVGEFAGAGDHSVPFRTTFMEVDTDNHCDTVAVIDSCMQPLMSRDGTEMFLSALRATDEVSSGWTYDMLIFDTESGESYYPAPSVDLDRGPFRMRRGAPLYFLRASLDSNTMNLWRLTEGSTLEQVSDFTEPPFPNGYEITSDSVIYYYPEPSHPVPDSSQAEEYKKPDSVHFSVLELMSSDAALGFLTEVDSSSQGVEKSHFIVRILDFEKQLYEVLDTIVGKAIPGTVCDIGSALMYLRQAGDTRELVLAHCAPNFRSEVLAASDEPEDNPWLFEIDHLSVCMADSLIAYSTRYWSAQIRSLNPSAGFAVVRKIRDYDGYHPRFNATCNAVYLLRNTLSEDELPKALISYCDIESGRVSQVLATKRNVHEPQQVAGDSLVFYIRSDKDVGRNVWKYSAGAGETQITFFEWPLIVEHFLLTDDSILCVVKEFGAMSKSDREHHKILLP